MGDAFVDNFDVVDSVVVTASVVVVAHGTGKNRQKLSIIIYKSSWEIYTLRQA